MELSAWPKDNKLNLFLIHFFTNQAGHEMALKYLIHDAFGGRMVILSEGCSCRPLLLERVKRSLWMRLLPGLRAYRCQICGEFFLASKKKINDIQVSERLKLLREIQGDTAASAQS